MAILNKLRKGLKALYESFNEITETDIFKDRIAQVIFEKLNNFISYTITHSHQDSQVDIVTRLHGIKNQEVKMAESTEQLLQQEQDLSNRTRGRFSNAWFCCILTMLPGGILLVLGLEHDSYVYPGGALFGFGFLFAIGMCVYGLSNDRHQNQARILDGARNRLFQAVNEAKSDNNNNLSEPLLSAEQQSEYKEDDEESNFRPSSPSTKR